MKFAFIKNVIFFYDLILSDFPEIKEDNIERILNFISNEILNISKKHIPVLMRETGAEYDEVVDDLYTAVDSLIMKDVFDKMKDWDFYFFQQVKEAFSKLLSKMKGLKTK